MVGGDFPPSFVASYAEKVGFLPSDSIISSDIFQIPLDVFQIPLDVFQIPLEIFQISSEIFRFVS